MRHCMQRSLPLQTSASREFDVELKATAVLVAYPSPCPSPARGEGTLWHRSSRLQRRIGVMRLKKGAYLVACTGTTGWQI